MTPEILEPFSRSRVASSPAGALRRAFRSGRPALIPFFTAGFPDERTFLALVKGAARVGADAIEIGIPFSDPLADGPAIQHASKVALDRGMTLPKALRLIRELARTVSCPLLVMGYANPILQQRLRPFAAAARRAGVAGVIVPDLPLDESAPLEFALMAQGVPFIPLIAPTSTPERIRAAGAHAAGFLYLVSTTGVTGVRRNLPPGLPAFVADVRRETMAPIAVGFGISTPAQAAAVAETADGVILGSVIVEAIRRHGPGPRGVAAVSRLLTRFRKALDRVRTRSSPAGAEVPARMDRPTRHPRARQDFRTAPPSTPLSYPP